MSQCAVAALCVYLSFYGVFCLSGRFTR